MAWKDRKEDDRREDTPEREGDVLGISDAKPGVGEPRHAAPGRRRPSGIEVRDHATGIGDVPRSDGASGVDMGGGGEGTHVSSTERRTRTMDPDVDE
jgi:hypothetical protein